MTTINLVTSDSPRRARFDSGNSGNGFTASHTTSTDVPWAVKAGADADPLLDLTDPEAPTVTSSGVYAVTLTVSPDSVPPTSPDTYIKVRLGAVGPSSVQVYAPMPVSSTAPTATVVGLYYLDEGAPITATVNCHEPDDSVYYGDMAIVKVL